MNQKFRRADLQQTSLIARPVIKNDNASPVISDAEFTEIDPVTGAAVRSTGNTSKGGQVANNPAGAAPGSIQVPGGTTVHIDQRGQMYRPWKEELGVSFAKSLGHGLAFPFKLVGELLKGVLGGVLGIVRTAVLVLLIPILLIKGYQFAQENRDKNAEQIATEVGANSGTIAKSVAKGLKDGVAKP